MRKEELILELEKWEDIVWGLFINAEDSNELENSLHALGKDIWEFKKRVESSD